MNGTTLEVLLIEDDELDRKAVLRALGKTTVPFAVTEASTAAQALEFLSEKTFDVILLDHGLPDREGLEVLRCLQSEMGITTPVIMVSGQEDEQLAEACLELGAQDFILKDEVTGRRLKRAIGQAKQRKAILDEKDGLARNLQSTNEKLAALNKAKDNLLTILAHDLINPLSGLSYLLDLAVEAPHSFRSMDELLVEARRSANLTWNLLENLLGWVQGQFDQGSLELVSQEVMTIVASVVSTLEKSAQEKQIAIKVEGQSDLTARTDSRSVEVIVRNLVSNALKFSHKGSSVRVRVVEITGHPVVEVIDQGIGMSLERQKTLFSGQKTNSKLGTESEKGHGLGLKFCGDLVKNICGKIQVESRVGAGSTFRLFLSI